MRDMYYLKSVSTFCIIYSLIVAFLYVFTVVTGFVGSIFIFVTILFLLFFYYNGFVKFKKIRNRFLR
ncbi:helicase loader DnaB [Candidatus Kuenenia stuttgartiensis]|uniref:Helicase loader DnaB n=1 Tax=Kuenenia stuttgartiensis TaxID=174633 RepID=Q1Q271_KUEST|nr:helicase loader DnaB [Candidatus Kuenenia stuttgartiensis]CAJ74111.1 unknown protein [Candidatus Kuenenia stuttgartiensis]SOH03293.1 hypothetical protein KSMBR1_0782 [Candidatus Kuenenia stuttgartiensis]